MDGSNLYGRLTSIISNAGSAPSRDSPPDLDIASIAYGADYWGFGLHEWRSPERMEMRLEIILRALINVCSIRRKVLLARQPSPPNSLDN